MNHPKDHSLFGLGLPGYIQQITINNQGFGHCSDVSKNKFSTDPAEDVSPQEICGLEKPLFPPGKHRKVPIF